MLVVFLAVEGCAGGVGAKSSDLLRLAHLLAVRAERARAHLLWRDLNHCLLAAHVALIRAQLVGHRVVSFLVDAELALRVLVRILFVAHTLLATSRSCLVDARAAKVRDRSRRLRLFLLRHLLELDRDASVLRRCEFREYSFELVSFENVAQEDELVDVLGALGETLRLQSGNRSHAIAPWLLAEAKLASKIERRRRQLARLVGKHLVLNQGSLEQEERDVPLHLAGVLEHEKALKEPERAREVNAEL